MAEWQDEELGVEAVELTERKLHPAEKVRLLLGKSVNDDIPLERFLFCQLNYLCHFESGDAGWKQISRWIKYEEKVEKGNRWSKPHVATTFLRHVLYVRNGLANDDVVVDLDMPCLDLPDEGAVKRLMTKVVDAISKKTNLPEKISQQLQEYLTRPHKHKSRKGKISNKHTEAFNPAPVQHAYPSGLFPDQLMSHTPNEKLLKKIPKEAEAANILVGQCEFLKKPLLALIRLAPSAILGDLTEVKLPTKFIFLALGPSECFSIMDCEELGRAVGSLLNDKVFCQVAYNAKTSMDVVAGIDEYVDGLTILPPSLWDPETRLEPPTKTMSQMKIQDRVQRSPTKAGPDVFNIGDDHEDPTLQKTGRLFGGLIQDIKRRYPLYWSDITDGFSIQAIASVIFLYFACITPIVTFGGLLGDGTGNHLGTMESILSGAICGLIYALFAGQPLTIVGATGPMLIFESLLYSFCVDRDLDFLAFRFWVGVWIALILLVFVAFDLSSLVQYITRFTEECFATLISLIFIIEAFKKVTGIWNNYPVGTQWSEGFSCYCEPNETVEQFTSNPFSNITNQDPYTYDNYTAIVSRDCVNSRGDLIVNSMCVTGDLCLEGGWITNGTGCEVNEFINAVPDVFFLCILLFIGTFSIAYNLKYFRESSYLPSFVRSNISDFAVITSIIICVGIDFAFGLKTPKLNVPSEFKTTLEGRGWLANPMALSWYMILLAIIPAMLATILIFLDQQITAVIVNRKEHKLKKGHGYHLDLFVLAILIVICSLLGLPWFVAATVRAISHVRSLFFQTETSAPGDKPEMLGVREQRFTGILIHLFIGASIFLTGILKYVPMPVLYGVFLYMGVTSLAGVQFIDRIRLLLMPKKYQPDNVYLRHVKTSRVHLFTIIQIFCMILMWVIKSIKSIAICFPIAILLICFIRKGLDKCFSQNELYWLDHLLPDASRKKAEDTININNHNSLNGHESSEKMVG